MKIFLSYRRDDTGGRAGRLYDVLVARYGARNVFQDVHAAPPGRDFTAEVDQAIAQSDAVLVVIGRGWMASPAPDGGRRVDRPDDFVRREVSAALAVGMPVVPVLVDGADLPPAAELPAEIAGLTRRQAVSVRDVSWHQDVDALIRRLEGEDPLPARRRRPLAVAVSAAIALVLMAVVAAVVLANRDDDDEADDDASGELPVCPSTDDTWARLDSIADEPVTVAADEAHTVEVRIVDGWHRSTGGVDTVIVDVSVANVTAADPATFDDDVYVGVGVIGGLLVDGIDQGEVDCVRVQGDPELEPTERAIASIGFDTIVDPAGAAITLEAFGDTDFPVTAASTGPEGAGE